MTRLRRSLLVAPILALLAWGAGCASHRNACEPCAEEKGCKYDCKAKTLFNWAICEEEKEDEPKEEEKGNGDEKDKENGNGKDKENGKEKEKDKNGNGKAFVPMAGSGILPVQAPGTPIAMPPSITGNGISDAGAGTILMNGGNGIAAEPEEPDTITTDRPDFTEASTTVGRGRIQIEMGYTYFRDRDRAGTLTQTHSYPEVLARIGMFADWFEWRIGQNFGHSLRAEAVTHRRLSTDNGAQDLYLGTKIALTEQKGYLPESAMIFQMTVPTGSQAFTSGKVLPGLSYLYSWELTDKVSLAGSVLWNVALEDSGHKFWQLANSVSIGASFTDKMGGYFEYFGFYPTGGIDPTTKPEYYLNGGFTYLITNNVQYDIRAGFGLNRAAADFFAGSGLSLRF